MARGGKRAGAGRPVDSGRFPGGSKTMRVPLAQIEAVKKFLATNSHALSVRSAKGDHDQSNDVNHTEAQVFRFIGDLIAEPDQNFIVTVESESMLDAGIHIGDILIVDRTRAAQECDIVVAMLHEKFTVNRYHRTRTGHVLLAPDNKAFKPLLTTSEELRLLGVVTHVIHKIN